MNCTTSAPATDLALAIEARGLGKSMDSRAILQGIDLSVRPGEYVAVLGANGAGKSTLLKLLATLTSPTEGTLSLLGRSAVKDTRGARARIGLVAHQSMLYRDLSPLENLRFFGRLYGLHDVNGRAATLLEVVGLAHRANEPVKRFSRGMVQRVAIARALMHDPALLLADEPFDGLDAPSADAAERLLERLNAAGKTIVLVNHDIRQSLRLARRVVVLRKGRMTMDRCAAGLDAAQVLSEVSAS